MSLVNNENIPAAKEGEAIERIQVVYGTGKVENKLINPLMIEKAIFDHLRGLYSAQDILRLQDMCAMVDKGDASYILRQTNHHPHELLTLRKDLGCAYSTFTSFIKKLLIHNIVEIHTKGDNGVVVSHIVLNPSLANRGHKEVRITMRNLNNGIPNLPITKGIIKLLK